MARDDHMDRRFDAVLSRALEWAREHAQIRALLLEGSRGNPEAKPDAFSDYDIAVVVTDVAPFVESAEWERWFGEPIIHWGDRQVDSGVERHMRLVVYGDGTRFDYCFWTVSAFAQLKTLPGLPAILDSGYEVLLDKDGVTSGLAPATHRAHIPAKPSESEFVNFLHDFWFDAAYVAKNLARDELLPGKFGMSLITGHLQRLLEWRSELDRGWSANVGRHGRGLRRFVPQERWPTLERTFAAADPNESWAALGAALDLHHDLAIEIASGLKFSYPLEQEAKALAYIHSLRGRVSSATGQ